jgi:hypothetical protein
MLERHLRAMRNELVRLTLLNGSPALCGRRSVSTAVRS